ncbi:MAG: hypothetical protein WCD86_22505 [Ktedonobacteraceae bacterium]
MSNQKFTTEYSADPFPVILEDDPIHVPPYYFCATDDPNCPCREDPELIDHVAQQYDAGFLTPSEADRIVGGRQANS